MSVPTPQLQITGTIGSGGIYPLLNAGNLVFPSDADYTMTYPDMTGFVINLTSGVALTATRSLICPLQLGFWFILYNNTTGAQSITVTGGSGGTVTIPNNGLPYLVSCDGTNYRTPPLGSITGVTAGAGLTGGGSSGAVSLALSSPVSVANGGTGTATPGLIGGTNVIITGNWPNQTVTAANGAGYSLGGTLTSANVALGPGAGTGATLNLVSGLDGTHEINITTGTSPTANGLIWTVTYTSSRGHNSNPVISLYSNYNYTDVRQIVGVGGNASTFYSGGAGPVALSASTQYAWSVSCP